MTTNNHDDGVRPPPHEKRPPSYLSGQDLVDAARELAAFAHKGQVRIKGKDKGKPYVGTHLTRVHGAVRKAHPDNYEAQALAWLHDGYEEHCLIINPEYLQQCMYPPAVIDGLIAISQNDGEGYLTYLKRAFLDPLVRIVKPHDMFDNSAGLVRTDGLETTMMCKYSMGIELFMIWGQALDMALNGEPVPGRCDFVMADPPTTGDYAAS